MIDFEDPEQHFAVYDPESNSVLHYGLVDEDGKTYIRVYWGEDYTTSYQFTLIGWKMILDAIRRSPSSQMIDATNLYQQMALFLYPKDHSTLMAVPIMDDELIFVDAEQLNILL